jgi:hypothetical protein
VVVVVVGAPRHPIPGRMMVAVVEEMGGRGGRGHAVVVGVVDSRRSMMSGLVVMP